MIKLLCKNRQIIRTDNQWIVEYARNVDPITAKFDAEWDDLSVSITFRNGDIGPFSVEYYDGIQIPPQFLQTGEIYISFEGRKSLTDDTVLLRTSKMKYPLKVHNQGDAIAMPPPDLPPSIWEEAIAKADEAIKAANNALEIVQGIRADADRILAAAAKPPIIGDNGNWYLWDFKRGEYYDSGKPSGGSGGASNWETLFGKPFDNINYNELEVIGASSDRKLGIRAVSRDKVVGLADELSRIDQSLEGKQPLGNYATKTELSSGLDTKQDKGDYATKSELPIKVSQLENDSRFVNETQLGAVNSKVEVNTQELAKKADKSAIPTKTSELTNDSDFSTNANVNVGLSKKLDLTGGTMQGKIDMGSFGITNLPDAVKNGEPVTFKQLNEAISGIGTVFNLKGSKPTFSALPKDGNKIGDVWFVEDESVGYIWIEKSGIPQWEKFGPSIDLSGYLTKKELLGTTGSATENTMSQDAITRALDKKQDIGDYATKTEVTNATKDKATKSELRDGLNGKQNKGDYATKVELSEGLASKQPVGDYATNTDLAEKQNKTKIVNVTMTTMNEGSSDVSSEQIIHWVEAKEEIKCNLDVFGELKQLQFDGYSDNYVYFKADNIITRAADSVKLTIVNNDVTMQLITYVPDAIDTTSEIPPELPSETEGNVQAVLNALSTGKLSKTGHTPNKNLAIDVGGNVVEADFEKPYVIVPSEQEVPYDEEHIVYREEDATGGGGIGFATAADLPAVVPSGLPPETPQNVQAVIDAIDKNVQAKMNKPTVTGTAGQFLTSDGVGGAVWTTVLNGEEMFF